MDSLTGRCPACDRFVTVEPLPSGGFMWRKHVDPDGQRCARGGTVVPPALEPKGNP